MRIDIKAVISDVEGQETHTEDIGVLEYDAETAPASGLGLFIGEAYQLLRQLQTVVLRGQAARFMERAARRWQCGSRLGFVQHLRSIRISGERSIFGR